MDKHILENHSNLAHLDLSKNEIQNLDADVFESLTRLVLLDLSNNLIHNFNNNTFVNLVNLNYLNLSSNALSEIKTGSFATLFHLEILDLSNNKLKTLDVNILPSRLVRKLNWFSIANNQLRELTGFTSSRLPNIRIIGVDSNKFSCWIDCNTANPGAEPNEEADVTTEAIQKLTSVFIGPQKVLKEIIQVNHQGINSSQELANYEQFNDGKNTNLPLISCIFIILCLVIIVAVLITFLLRKREYSEHYAADVLYRRNEMTAADAVENQHYDIVCNK
ncbi:toll-like receptor 6 [Bradysia coprophila]|uniref:toll-like receptor 6 n=1 Tax=Bradysia coprophila TaxID=38358 RepID=UPI00187DCE92|nr:toll-like receptor 6 [Bradysia coprophila]